jgi:hypothetical protein
LQNLTGQWRNASFAPRYKHAVPIKLSFEPGGKTGKADEPPKYVFIAGETVDLSTSGIGFIVSAIRVKESYLVGEGRILNVELDLPSGKVSMKAIGRRYEQVGEHVSTARYLIGASIEEISDEDREAYNGFLRYGGKENVHRLKFGIDQS